MEQTLEDPKNVKKQTIIDPSINKPEKPLSTDKAVRSFSITSATQINEKNINRDKFQSFNKLIETDEFCFIIFIFLLISSNFP